MERTPRPSQGSKLGLSFLAVVAIAAVLVAAVALALRRPGVVLYSHSDGPGEARFLVSDGTSIRYLRQSMTANSPAVVVDARNYAQFNAAAADGSTPVRYTMGGQVVTFTSMGMKFTPAAGPHSFAGVTWGDASFMSRPSVFNATARTVSVSYWTVLASAAVTAGLTTRPILRRRRAARRLDRGLCV
ncbi:MAG: hypothetical protein WBD40_20375, partial [Tepidisphaeraceae bacterium]